LEYCIGIAQKSLGKLKKKINIMNYHWDKTHKAYSKKDWIDKPTIFAEFALDFFPESGKLLDLGAGQGPDSRYFANQGFSVTSVDFNDLALELSKEKAEKESLKIEFMKLDVSNKLPFDDESFDIAYSHLALHYFSDEITREIFREISRILKPGGIIASLFNTVDDPEILDPAFVKISENFYRDPGGIEKRYFSVDYIEEITGDLFIPMILDNEGETYKDEIKTLIRFIGKADKYPEYNDKTF
jgi:SAM-dependent methyltransferase